MQPTSLKISGAIIMAPVKKRKKSTPGIIWDIKKFIIKLLALVLCWHNIGLIGSLIPEKAGSRDETTNRWLL